MVMLEVTFKSGKKGQVVFASRKDANAALYNYMDDELVTDIEVKAVKNRPVKWDDLAN